MVLLWFEVDLISSPLILICLYLIWLIRYPEKFIDGMLLGLITRKPLKRPEGCISDTKATQGKYLGLQNNINRLCKSLNDIDYEILTILKPENIKSHVSKIMGIMETMYEILAEITLKLENMGFKDSEQSFERDDNNILNTKLPELEFPVFKGNPLEWQSFYDQFNISFRQNKTLSDIDRFNYVTTYLAGQALATISGLTINSENYMEVLDILIDRYRNPQVLISAHMDTLVKMNKVKTMEIMILRTECEI